MTDSPQSKVGPNPSGLWLPPKERAQTSATSKANQHSLLTDTTGLEKVNRILSSSYLTEQQCSLFCNKTASLSNASTSSPTLCWRIPTKLTRPWQRRFCITNSTAPRGSVHHTIVFKCGVDTLTVHGIGLLQDSKDVKRAQREEKDEKAPSPKFNKKTKTYSCPPTWGVSSEDEVRCRKAR